MTFCRTIPLGKQVKPTPPELVVPTNHSPAAVNVAACVKVIASPAVPDAAVRQTKAPSPSEPKPTAGAVAYGTGSAYAFTLAGSSGQVLTSSGTGAPTWATPSAGINTGKAIAMAIVFGG